jgi:hypothetical protein
VRPRHRWEHILKMGLKEVECKGVCWIPWSSGRREHVNEFYIFLTVHRVMIRGK